MSTFQLPVSETRTEIGAMIAARLLTDQPGGIAGVHNASVNARVFLAEQPGIPGPEIAGILVRPGNSWPDFWQPAPGAQFWCWASRPGLITVTLFKAM